MSDTFSADSRAIGGAVVAPGAGATVAALTGLQSTARYKVRISTGMSGTIDTANAQNLRLTSGGVTLIGTLASVALESDILLDQLTLAATDLTVIAIAAFAAASIVNVSIVATRIG